MLWLEEAGVVSQSMELAEVVALLVAEIEMGVGGPFPDVMGKRSL